MWSQMTGVAPNENLLHQRWRQELATLSNSEPNIVLNALGGDKLKPAAPGLAPNAGSGAKWSQRAKWKSQMEPRSQMEPNDNGGAKLEPNNLAYHSRFTVLL